MAATENSARVTLILNDIGLIEAQTPPRRQPDSALAKRLVVHGVANDVKWSGHLFMVVLLNRSCLKSGQCCVSHSALFQSIR